MRIYDLNSALESLACEFDKQGFDACMNSNVCEPLGFSYGLERGRQMAYQYCRDRLRQIIASDSRPALPVLAIPFAPETEHPDFYPNVEHAYGWEDTRPAFSVAAGLALQSAMSDAIDRLALD